MTIESCHYTLKIRGRKIGSQVLQSQENRRIVYLESKLTLQGSIDEKTVKQSSRLYRPDFHSLYFREENQDKSHKRSYEVRFDRDAGLVKVFKDGGDNATAPYILPYQDPLGLMFQLRFIPVDQEYVRVPMLGRDVTVRQLPEVELELGNDLKIARVFELHPGGSLVYIDSEAPHNILKLNQRIGQQVIEAELDSYTQEEGYLNDDIRQSNRRDRSRRGGRGRGSGNSRGGRSKDRTSKDRTSKDRASTRGRGRSERSDRRSKSASRNRSETASVAKEEGSSSTSNSSKPAKPARSKRPRPSKSDRASRPDRASKPEKSGEAKTDSNNSSRPSRSKPSKNAPRSRRDSYQRSHKRNKPNGKSKDSDSE